MVNKNNLNLMLGHFEKIRECRANQILHGANMNKNDHGTNWTSFLFKTLDLHQQ
jgi:hypothetical protein